MTGPPAEPRAGQTTLVVSDLHLGARSGVDLLQRPAVRAALIEALDGVDRLVVLGDLLELRDGPLHEALDAARPVVESIGRALGDRPVLLVPGNHDHRLLEEWRERRRPGPTPPLAPEQLVEPAQASEAARALAAWLAPARLRLAYPGAWLSDTVYATHGHYLDRHITVPAFEPLAVRVLERMLRRRLERLGAVDGYEAVLAPVYALVHEVAQTAAPRDRRVAADPSAPPTSARLYRMLAGRGPRPLPHRLAGSVGFPALVAALNAAGLAPFRADLSGPELRRSALAAMGEVVERLGIEAEHVVFGHTHRAGPLGDDDLSEWRAPGGARLHNSGSWVRERFLAGPTPQRTPYRAGAAVLVPPAGAPTVRHLLDDPSYAGVL